MNVYYARNNKFFACLKQKQCKYLQYDKDNQLVREFACKHDCIKLLRMSDKTLAKALDKGQPYDGHSFKQIGSKLQIP